MADALGRAVGTPIDRKTAPREMERRCLGAFAERLFRLLISLAAAQPPLASSLFATISAEAVRYLDDNLLDQLTAEYLVALLTTAADRWREYQKQIRDLIEIADPAAVVKLVGLYEQTKDLELQGFMSGPLLQHAEVLGEATTVAGIAEAVRRKLGVGAGRSERERWARWSRTANRALEELHSRSAAEEPPLVEVVASAHFATLGLHLSREELGLTTFDELLKKGPLNLRGGGRNSHRLGVVVRLATRRRLRPGGTRGEEVVRDGRHGETHPVAGVPRRQDGRFSGYHLQGRGTPGGLSPVAEARSRA